jgi:tetratricopeptide (TPR) repeat protein
MEKETATLPPLAEAQPFFRLFPFYNRKQAGFFLFLIALVFYSPSFYNEYALDDGITIHQNSHVLRGIRGIPDILVKDAYHSFYERMNASDQLQGGRYRPLPYITHALEQELIGTYRTGFYNYAVDLNKNGVLDEGQVEYKRSDSTMAKGYEYNAFVDINNDGIAQPNECSNCWDTNKNFKNDASEDLNVDSVVNEPDCYTYGSSFRHFNNIMLYALGGLLIYLVFSTCFFAGQQDVAFAAALLFVIHPVHSEVVANVRGRDDLLSVIFIMLTFYCGFRAVKLKSTVTMVLAGVCMFLALMSKEYALLMYLFFPLSLFVALKEPVNLRSWIAPLLLFIAAVVFMCYMDIQGWYLNLPPALFFFLVALVFTLTYLLVFRETIQQVSVGSVMIVLFIGGIVYVALRLNAVNMKPGTPDTEILNNPYLFASGSQAFATQVYTLFLYLKVALLPHPLICDYSYATIAYRKLSDVGFIASFILHAGLLVTGILLCRRRHILGLAILFYLCFLLSVSNLFFPSGAMMLENFLYHASLGLCMVLGWLLVSFAEKLHIELGAKRYLLLGILAACLVLGGIKAWERSRDWKNDVTLFLKDVHNAPHSVLVLGNAGARWIDLADKREITGISAPGQDTTRFNDYNGTLKISEEEVRSNGYQDKREAALRKGMSYLEHAVELHPRYVNGYLNLGLAHFKLNEEKKAIYYWKVAETIYPANPFLKLYFDVYSSILKERGSKALENDDPKGALAAFKKWTTIRPKDPESWYMAGGVCYRLNNRTAARKYWEKALLLKPDYSDAKKALDLLSLNQQQK